MSNPDNEAQIIVSVIILLHYNSAAGKIILQEGAITRPFGAEKRLLKN